LRGKSLMRNAFVHSKGYSELEAAQLIDTLALRGFLKILGDTSGRTEADSRWAIEPRPKF